MIKGPKAKRRYFAFLRAINVGGHNVKMDDLFRLFGAFGFSEVETFIASGNVIFSSSEKNTASLEEKIAAGLKKALHYEVAVFMRTEEELARIAGFSAFPQPALDAAAALNIAFLRKAPDAGSKQKLMNLKTEIDDFVVDGREIYWLCRVKQSESTFSGAVLENTLGSQATFRSMNTIRKISAKYAPPAPLKKRRAK
jgi:uncharacterized protein (DUF1697 family)